MLCTDYLKHTVICNVSSKNSSKTHLTTNLNFNKLRLGTGAILVTNSSKHDFKSIQSNEGKKKRWGGTLLGKKLNKFSRQKKNISQHHRNTFQNEQHQARQNSRYWLLSKYSSF